MPAGPERDRAELDLRIVLGGAFIAVKGWAMPEVGRAYQRARELCTGEDRFPQLQAALSGLFVHHLHAVRRARRLRDRGGGAAIGRAAAGPA